MKNKITAAVFFAVLAAALILTLLPADTESVKSENREAQEFPRLTSKTVFSGKFAEEFESALADHIAFRAPIIRLARLMQEKQGITLKAGKIISIDKDIGTGTTQKQTLLLANNAVMEMFIQNKEQEKIYADAVNAYARKLPQNIKIYSMLMPTQLEFCEPLYKNLQDSQLDAINSIYEKIDTRVIPVDVYSALEEHKDEYIYFKTDHHWTQLGAYYGYRAFMEAEGGNAANKEDYEKNEIHNVLGYLYDRAPSSDIASYPDTIEWYNVDPASKIRTVMHDTNAKGALTDYRGVMYDRSFKNYRFFFGSDHPVVEMTNSENQQGKTIAVIKDSYTNVFAPWLIKSYHKVILVDPRVYTGSFDTIIKTYNPDELLITNYIFTTVFKDYTDLMMRSLSQQEEIK